MHRPTYRTDKNIRLTEEKFIRRCLKAGMSGSGQRTSNLQGGPHNVSSIMATSLFIVLRKIHGKRIPKARTQAVSNATFTPA